MSSSTQEIVHEGWLTKSPPTKRIWKGKWRRRWFALRQSGELPGQYYLDYYSDRNCRKLKGRINLDLCDQVDAGLYMERDSGVEESRERGTVFSVRTADRIYHLKADNEADMEKWVDAICRVCCLRAEQPSPPPFIMAGQSVMQQQEPTSRDSPYIPISECITGPRSMDTSRPRAYTFDGKKLLGGGSGLHSEPDSATTGTHSDDSAMDSQTGSSRLNDGPPVPPRPDVRSSTFRLVKDGTHRNQIYVGRDNVFYHNGSSNASTSCGQNSSRNIYSNGVWFGRRAQGPTPIICVSPLDYGADSEVQRYTRPLYWNIPQLHNHTKPPVVDRNLKPRFGYHGSSHHVHNQGYTRGGRRDRSDALQYLDLDWHPSRPSTSKDFSITSPSHGKSRSVIEEPDTAYKTIDFIKTEALNNTRRDAEALRSSAVPL